MLEVSGSGLERERVQQSGEQGRQLSGFRDFELFPPTPKTFLVNAQPLSNTLCLASLLESELGGSSEGFAHRILRFSPRVPQTAWMHTC